jgi:hypothetical protein
MLFGEECDITLSRHLAILFIWMLVMVSQVKTFANEKLFELVDLDQRLEGNTKLGIG